MFQGLHQVLTGNALDDALQFAELIVVVEVTGNDEGGAVGGARVGERVDARQHAQDAGEAHRQIGIEVLGAQLGDGATLLLQALDF